MMFLPEQFPDTALLSEKNISEMRFSTRVQSILPSDFESSEINDLILLYFHRIVSGEAGSQAEGNQSDFGSITGPLGEGDQGQEGEEEEKDSGDDASGEGEDSADDESDN